MLNNSSPKIDPCGTPKVISSHESVLVYLSNLPVKSIWIHFKEILPNRIPVALLLKAPERDSQKLLISPQAAPQKIYIRRYKISVSLT